MKSGSTAYPLSVDSSWCNFEKGCVFVSLGCLQSTSLLVGCQGVPLNLEPGSSSPVRKQHFNVNQRSIFQAYSWCQSPQATIIIISLHGVASNQSRWRAVQTRPCNAACHCTSYTQHCLQGATSCDSKLQAATQTRPDKTLQYRPIGLLNWARLDSTLDLT